MKYRVSECGQSLTGRLAMQFRTAVVAAMRDRSINLVSFTRFPHGSCGDVCNPLARYLAENIVRTAEVVETHQQGALEE